MISERDSRDAFFDEVLALARQDRDVIFMTADMGAFSLEQFKRELPGQFLNVGVAEQNMVSVAAGLALAGKQVFIYSIVPFATLRCYEQIKIDLCCMNLPVTVVGIGAGVMYGGDGPTHHALHDIAVMRALPEMTILNPADATCTQACARLAYAQAGPVYVRVEKGRLPVIYDQPDADFPAGAALVREGADVLVIASGLMTHSAMQAADQLAGQGVAVGVVDLYRVKPLNVEWLSALLRRYPRVITLEEHALVGGIGSAVSELITDAGLLVSLRRLAWPDEHCHEFCSREQIHARYQMDPAGIAAAIQEWLAE